MRFLSFRKPGVYSIFILTYTLFNILLYFLSQKIDFELKVVVDHYITSFSQILSGIFVLVLKIILKNSKKEIEASTLQINKTGNTSDKLLKNSETKSKKEISKFIPYILLTDLSLVIAVIISKIPYNFKGNYAFICFTPIYFITTCILCYIILNYRIFRHHLLGIIILMIGSLFTFKYLLEDKSDTLIKTLKMVFYNIFFGMFFVFIKKVMEKFSYRTHYEILFYIGLFNLVYALIASLILQFINNKDYNIGKDTNLIKIFGNHKKLFQWDMFQLLFKKREDVFKFIGLIVLRFGFYFSIISIIKQYSPLHCIMADSIYVLIKMVVKNIIDNKGSAWEVYVSLIIMILGSLIYIEVIVLHFWGLDENTKLNIMDRADEDKITRMSRIDFFITEDEQKEKDEHNLGYEGETLNTVI